MIAQTDTRMEDGKCRLIGSDDSRIDVYGCELEKWAFPGILKNEKEMKCKQCEQYKPRLHRGSKVTAKWQY